MLNRYTVKVDVEFEAKIKCGFLSKRTKTINVTIPFNFVMIAHDVEELCSMIKEKFDNYVEKVVSSGTFYPWSQVCGCCDWNVNFDKVLTCSHRIDPNNTMILAYTEVRKLSAKDTIEELTIDQIIEVWGLDVARLFFNS